MPTGTKDSALHNVPTSSIFQRGLGWVGLDLCPRVDRLLSALFSLLGRAANGHAQFELLAVSFPPRAFFVSKSLL